MTPVEVVAAAFADRKVLSVPFVQGRTVTLAQVAVQALTDAGYLKPQLKGES